MVSNPGLFQSMIFISFYIICLVQLLVCFVVVVDYVCFFVCFVLFCCCCFVVVFLIFFFFFGGGGHHFYEFGVCLCNKYTHRTMFSINPLNIRQWRYLGNNECIRD